ncbi:hypothetical protein ACFVZR_37710 [Streptomyces sp. NPDC058316]|uniref:hypothetical protein n=1 Tax=unclassified Streptomyces TaxID=2593676 RepID=UPI0033342A45
MSEDLYARPRWRLIDDGCVVFAISSRLLTALAGAEQSRLRDVAASGVKQRSENGEVVEAEIVDEIVSELAALVRSARGRSQDVYCWVA